METADWSGLNSAKNVGRHNLIMQAIVIIFIEGLNLTPLNSLSIGRGLTCNKDPRHRQTCPQYLSWCLANPSGVAWKFRRRFRSVAALQRVKMDDGSSTLNIEDVRVLLFSLVENNQRPRGGSEGTFFHCTCAIPDDPVRFGPKMFVSPLKRTEFSRRITLENMQHPRTYFDERNVIYWS